MTRRPFSCRNTLERLRENADESQQNDKDTNRMITARVEYTVTVTGEDGKTISVNTERILYELSTLDPDYIRQILEQEEQAKKPPQLKKPSLALPSS